MADSDLPSFPVLWDGQTYQVQTKQSDIARVEAQYGKSASGITQTAEMGFLLALAWHRLRKMGVTVPATFDEFLDGDPEIDMEKIEAGGDTKADSTNATETPSTGS